MTHHRQIPAVSVGQPVALSGLVRLLERLQPVPVLHAVADLEHQRTTLAGELASMRTLQATQQAAGTITRADVRQLVRRLFAGIAEAAQDSDQRAEARLALHEVLERVEMDPHQKETPVVLHYAVQTGVIVATPRGGESSPAVRWSSEPVALGARRRKGGG